MRSLLGKTSPEPVDLSFRDVCYSVSARTSWVQGKVEKVILEGVSGEFRAGELTAILGPSGAGKSTLLNILAGYIGGFTGSVSVNGRPRDSAANLSFSYIMQEDYLNPYLSVRETMRTAAELKLRVSRAAKEREVGGILESLGLARSGGTLVGRLSGGERKKLAIALELLSDPPVLFLDEPTSGLDSLSGRQTVRLLKGLSQGGRTVVTTLHQPPASTLALIDHLYCVTGGRCGFAGDPALLPSFLSSLDLLCPSYHNPADHLVEACSGSESRLVAATENGRVSCWRKLIDYRPQSTPCLFSENVQVSLISPLTHSPYPVPFCTQVLALIRRSFLVLRRDRFLLHTRVLMHIAAGLLIGTFYLNIGNDAAFVFENFSLLFFNLIFLVFSALSSMIISFPAEVLVVKRETFNRWYPVRAYYIAGSLSELPVQALCSLLYSTIVYLMTAQPRDPARLSQFLAVSLLASLTAQSTGFLVGALMDVQNGVIFGPLSIMPWVILSGYFLHVRDAPGWLRWLFQLSYLRYGLEGLMVAVYGSGRSSMPCSIDYCHYRSPAKFLRELGMEQSVFWHDLLIVLAFLAVTKLLTFLVLHYKLTTHRKA